MKYKLIILLALFFLAAKCRKEEVEVEQTDESGVVISKPFVWEKSLHENEDSSNSFFEEEIIYDGNIGIPTTNGEGNRYLSFINPATGETLWKWNDIYNAPTERVNISYSYEYNNLLTYQYGINSYCINLNTGNTNWKSQRNVSFTNKILPYQENYYFTFAPILNSDNNFEYIAYKGNIETGEIAPFLKANLSSEYVSPRESVGGINYISTIPENENLLLVTYSEPLPNWEVNSFFGLYNTLSNTWLWERKLLSEPTVNTSVHTPPLIYNNKAYANVGKEIVCHDLETGEQVWKRQFMQDFMFSGFIIVENKLIGNNEDGILYCLNPDTGDIIWQTQGSGTSSRLSYLNGVVYFVGGADVKLHAVDINKGETVWLLDAKYLDKSMFKINAVSVFAAEGDQPAKVIALTIQHAYCFEAFR